MIGVVSGENGVLPGNLKAGGCVLRELEAFLEHGEMNPVSDDPGVLSPGSPRSQWLSGPPWTPRRGSEYEGSVRWGSPR